MNKFISQHSPCRVNVRGSDAHCRHSRDRSRRPDSPLRGTAREPPRPESSHAPAASNRRSCRYCRPSRMICARSASPWSACDQRRQRLKAHIAFGEMRVGGVDIGGIADDRGEALPVQRAKPVALTYRHVSDAQMFGHCATPAPRRPASRPPR